MAETRLTIAGLALIAALMTSAIAIERVRDRVYALTAIEDQSLYLTSGAAVGRMSLGFKALAADLYWIRTLQYFGDIQRAHRDRGAPSGDVARREYDTLYPLLDLTTTLDPLFNLAYRFGAIFLSESPPSGPGRPDLAIKLLEKGLQARPERWEYLQDIGFVHYWSEHDYAKAADAFRAAAEVPGAPIWLKPLAATTLAEGGDRRSSRMLFTQLMQTAEIDWLKSSAERRLLQLDALDAIDQLQAAVNRYRERMGQPPADWVAMARANFVRGIPLDPAGTPYALMPDGRVRLANTSTLWPLPEEPQSLKRPVS